MTVDNQHHLPLSRRADEATAALADKERENALLRDLLLRRAG